MTRDLSSAQRRCGLVLLLAGVALLVLPVTAPAQDVKVFFWPEAEKPKDPDLGITTLLLRPNAAQQFFVFIHNREKEALNNVVVQLRAGGKPAVTVNLAKVPAGTQLVSMAPPPPPAAAPPAPAQPEQKELPAEVEVVALVGNKVLATAAVRVARPNNYIEAPAATF